MDEHAPVLVAGSDTVLGAALVSALRKRGHTKIVTDDGDAAIDWTDRTLARAFFTRHGIRFVFVAAGKSGGIAKNRRTPATLMWDNLTVAATLLDAAHHAGVTKLLYLGSSCSYPRDAAQPMAERALLTGPLEPTSEAYSIAKIAGIKLCEAFRVEHGSPFTSAIPANMFGPGDDFSPDDSHVIAALVRRAHEAKVAHARSLSIWGSGKAVREFLFAADAADACLFVMERYEDATPINLGPGTTLSIAELAPQIAKAVGFEGELVFDSSKPDGAPMKRLDTTRLAALGWTPRTSFPEALAATYRSYLESHART